MPLTIALSGMDNATETALRAAFAGANAQLGEPFVLIAEGDAEHVIVDMDSMYGPMSWLRLHAAGKQIVGLTSAPRVQTHFRLGRPFDDQSMATLLREIAGHVDGAGPAGGATQAPAAMPSTGVPEPVPDVFAPTPATPSARGDEAPGASPAVPDIATVAPADTATPVDALPDAPAPATVAAAGPDAQSDAGPERALPFATWLQSGVMRGRRRYRRETGPTLWLDFDGQQYHGPSTLKPLVQYFEGAIERDAFEPVDPATWDREAAPAGGAQPLLRLVWLGALLAGDGALAPGYDPDARYQLHKWPQTEREYPRHFRIATAMMKGPATLEEIIAASGLPAEDVLRFVNANLATGYAEPVVETPPAPETTERSAGFFSRLRRR